MSGVVDVCERELEVEERGGKLRGWRGDGTASNLGVSRIVESIRQLQLGWVREQPGRC